RAQQKVESQRAYLQVVLSNLSSGVITFDLDLRFRTSNDAASEILGIDLKLFRRSSIQKIVQVYPSYSNLFWPLQEHMITSEKEWSEQLEIFGAGKRQVLICRSTALPDGAGIQSGYVVVFDDITNLIQAQRNSAWGEVARRLAHEIKNPLTPIQLSAERLRRKLLVKIEGKDATILEKSTNTIIQQVEAMKEMVNAFSEYAKTPQMNIVPLDVNQLLEDVVELYQHKKDVVIELKANRQELTIKADTVRLRQVFHNLIKNALEALDGVENAKIEIVSNCTESNSCQFVEIDFIDNGPGIADNLINQLFEPYMTTKTKGTGLGLAIVKKIIEEHGGVISASNSDGGGAFIAIRLPVNSS
ncbi:MAG: GHKL domain-containing protein, partial [Methylococcales bacterium]|nr:GHKL domain-containing protein [Methylococcales bacterium]